MAIEKFNHFIDLSKPLLLNPLLNFSVSRAYNDMGLAYQASGMFAESKDSYNEALKLYPTNDLAKDNLNNLEYYLEYRDIKEEEHTSESFSKYRNLLRRLMQTMYPCKDNTRTNKKTFSFSSNAMYNVRLKQ